MLKNRKPTHGGAILREDMLPALNITQGELVLTPAKVFDKAAFMLHLDANTKKLPNGTSVIDAIRNDERYLAFTLIPA